MSMVRANGVSLHVQRLEPARGTTRTTASGAPLPPPTAVMIHGIAIDNLASWYFTLAKPLADAGFRIVMYDLRGHGRSERPPHGYQLDGYVDDLAALLAELGIDGPVHLLGNCFGGTVAFSYAIRHPALVSSIVAIESSPPTETWRATVAHQMGELADKLTSEGTLARISKNREKRIAAYDTVTAAIIPGIAGSPLPTENQIAAISCPVLCVYGGKSKMAVKWEPQVRALLPHARVVTVPNQMHWVLVDQSEAVREIVVPWLRQECDVEPVNPPPL
jgi:pimeloyl-ACP methyl ester carboxylesterase